MAVKIGKAMGCKVTVISRNSAKKQAAINDLGADDYLDLSNPEEVKASGKRFHMIMNTISADFDLNAYNSMLKIRGT